MKLFSPITMETSKMPRCNICWQN